MSRVEDRPRIARDGNGLVLDQRAADGCVEVVAYRLCRPACIAGYLYAKSVGVWSKANGKHTHLYWPRTDTLAVSGPAETVAAKASTARCDKKTHLRSTILRVDEAVDLEPDINRM